MQAFKKKKKSHLARKELVLVLTGVLNFCHSSYYGDVLQICTESSTDNTDVLVTAGQSSQSIKVFSAPSITVGYTRSREGT